MIYWVYEIKIKGIRRYVGITNDIVKRQKQHNYLMKKMTKKMLYNMIKKTSGDDYYISLEKLKPFKTKVDARRFECLIILNDYFGQKALWQRVPRISDI